MRTGLDSTSSRANAQYYWSLTITIVGLIVGLAAPFIGAIADNYGNRMKWIYLFSALLIVGAFSSWFGLPAGKPNQELKAPTINKAENR